MTKELNISTTEVSPESLPRLCADPNCPFQKVERVSASEFAAIAQQLGDLAKSGGLEPPVFQSPTRLDGVDRTIRYRKSGTPVVAINLHRRAAADVQNDMIEGVIVATELSEERADRFRVAATRVLQTNATVEVETSQDQNHEIAAKANSDTELLGTATQLASRDQSVEERSTTKKTQRNRRSRSTSKVVEPVALKDVSEESERVTVGSAA